MAMDKTFQMKKDDSASLPPSLETVIIGLGWTTPKNVDLDASVICLD